MSKKVAKNLKRLDAYNQTKPEQLSLFELLAPEDKKYSNSIELYDFIPKYFWGKLNRINGQFLLNVDRWFECRGIRYKVTISPARITDKDGNQCDFYPTEKEELVEDALRKLACEGQGCFLDDEAGVTFTLYELREELKSMGHTYSLDQIKTALLICAKTNIEVKTEDGKAVIVSNLFETLGLQTWEDWTGHGQKTKAFVRFNSLVTNSIKNRMFRQLNYEKTMSYKSVIARQLHKRMSHHYIQASTANSYDILLTTIIRDFGLTAYDKLANNLRDIKTALDEMKEKEVLLSYEIQKVFDLNRSNRLIDAKFILRPHTRFCAEMIKANERSRTIKLAQIPATK